MLKLQNVTPINRENYISPIKPLPGFVAPDPIVYSIFPEEPLMGYAAQ